MKTMHRKKERGSLLIEAIVAISIFMVGFGSVLVLNAQALHIVPQISRRLIAAELAQEGVEIVRNHITTNAIRGGVFNANLQDGYYSAYSALEGPVLTGGQYCGVSPCSTQLYISDATKNYSPIVGGTQTSFKRTVYVQTVANNEVRINSIVTWDGSEPSLGNCATNQGECINVEDHIFDWQ